MTINLTWLFVAAPLTAFVAVVADRRLRSNDRTLRPYRYGYFLASCGLLLAVSTAWTIATTSAIDTFRTIDLIPGGLGATIAVGVGARRKFGWWISLGLFGLMVVLGILFAATSDLVTTAIFVALSALLLWLNWTYARRRWLEFSDSSRVGTEMATLSDGSRARENYHCDSQVRENGHSAVRVPVGEIDKNAGLSSLDLSR